MRKWKRICLTRWMYGLDFVDHIVGHIDITDYGKSYNRFCNSYIFEFHSRYIHRSTRSYEVIYK
jgi:hypothetical protein